MVWPIHRHLIMGILPLTWRLYRIISSSGSPSIVVIAIRKYFCKKVMSLALNGLTARLERVWYIIVSVVEDIPGRWRRVLIPVISSGSFLRAFSNKASYGLGGEGRRDSWQRHLSLPVSLPMRRKVNVRYETVLAVSGHRQ